MQNKYEKVELILENCEVITIEGQYIKGISVKDIKKFNIDLEAKHFSLIIDRKADINEKTTIWRFETNLIRNNFKQLTEQLDIVAVHIYFANKKHMEFYVDFDEDNNDFNKYQKSYINDSGDLYITIDRNKELKDVFKCQAE